MLDPVQGQFGCRGEVTFSMLEQAGMHYFLTVLWWAGGVDGNLWSRSALAQLPPCSGAGWGAGPARLCRRAGARGEKVISSVEGTQPVYFLFQKTAQHAPHSVYIISANLREEEQGVTGTPEQPCTILRS